MAKKRRVPEDLMENILGEGSRVSDEEQFFSDPRGSYGAAQRAGSPSPVGKGAILWEERPERVGVTFNLSKQLSAELERLWQELQLEGDVCLSRSEITEAALRIVIEDVREKARESALFRRLSKRAVDQTVAATGGMTDEGGRTTRRSVDEAGFIIETTYDENGEIVDENMVAAVADLPVEAESMDGEGRLVCLARDELGNAFEWVMDVEFNTLGARIVQDPDQNAR